MHRAINLAQRQANGKLILPVYDTGDTPEGAARAAVDAVGKGASVILGPVFGPQMVSVAAAVGSTIPIISFSNSTPPPGGLVFTFGITPSQSVSAILQYARSRGVRRIAVLGSGSHWSKQGIRAAEQIAPEIELQLSSASPPIGLAPSGLMAALRAASGALPDAVLLTGEAIQFASYAGLLQSNGVQVLGTIQALSTSRTDFRVTEGAWLSGLDPNAFDSFVQTFGSAESPGMIAALAYDAARFMAILSQEGELTRQRLLASAGFRGVTGAVGFREDGRCVRELAIVTIAGGRMLAVSRRVAL